MGFDQPRPLGDRETGGGLALPIWISYMAKSLSGVPEAVREMPSGVIQLGGEYYFVEHQPGQGVASVGLEDILAPEEQVKRESVRDQIF
jgi:penicillin-binding protein 1A